MNAQSQREVLAQACGWERTDIWRGGWMKRTEAWPNGLPGDIPDYPNDLNAIHEAVLLLVTDELMACFHTELYIIVLRDNLKMACNEHRRAFMVENATAKQRTEALVRLLGKWE